MCSKGGFIVPAAVTPGTLTASDIVGRSHSLAPAFLADQVQRSRRNLGIETIDVYYLHNPESQLDDVGLPELMTRLHAAFEVMEALVTEGAIAYYGIATWHGLRDGALSLADVAALATRIAGSGHHFRFVQLPFNLGMQEASARSAPGIPSVLEEAADLGIAVIASASMLQARLTRDLPAAMAGVMPGLFTDAQRAIQFTRSTPGISSALVGMGSTHHVLDNLAVVKVPRMTPRDYQFLRATLF